MMLLREPHAERPEDQRDESPHFHECEGFSRTAIWADGERGECFFVDYELGFGGPAFGDEVVGVGEVAGIYGGEVQFVFCGCFTL